MLLRLLQGHIRQFVVLLILYWSFDLLSACFSPSRLQFFKIYFMVFLFVFLHTYIKLYKYMQIGK